MARIHRCGLGICLTFTILTLVLFVFLISFGYTLWAEAMLAIFLLLCICGTLYLAYLFKGPICRWCRRYVHFVLNLNEEPEPEAIPMNPAGNQGHVWNLEPGHVWAGVVNQNIPNGAVPGQHVPNGAGIPGQNAPNGAGVPGQNVPNGGIRRFNAPNRRNNQDPE